MKESTVNFFRDRRLALGLSLTQMGARAATTAQTVFNWEAGDTVPSATIATLATAYEVAESRMEKEVMAQRRRIEAKREPVSSK